jgi:short-subunit dehydrogenase
VLVARRAEKLEELALELNKDYGVKTLCRTIDLMAEDASDQLEKIAEEVEVGLFIVNAGGDTVAKAFLDAEFNDWRSLIGRNVLTLTENLHRFGRRFVARGSGGLVVVGSDSAFNGAGRLSIYSASKAYALNLMESLWAELKPKNVDVAYVVIGSTDTPKLRGLIQLRGIDPTEMQFGVPAEIARWAIELVGDGPTLVYDADPGSTDALSSPQARRARVERNTKIMDFFYGELKEDVSKLGLSSGRSWK